MVTSHSDLTGFGTTQETTASVTLRAAPTTPITLVATVTIGAAKALAFVMFFRLPRVLAVFPFLTKPETLWNPFHMSMPVLALVATALEIKLTSFAISNPVENSCPPFAIARTT